MGKQRETSWQDNPLHGLYHQQFAEVVDIEKIMPVAGKSWT